MIKPCFITLAVERACPGACACWHTYDNICTATPAVIDFREVVDDLIETTSDEVCKLHFDHCLVSFEAHAKGSAEDSTFTKWCITNTILTEFFDKTIGNFKHTTVVPDILTHQHKLRMFLHGFIEACSD